MEIEKRKIAFAELGRILSNVGQVQVHDKLEEGIEKAEMQNPWFIRPHIEYALQAIGNSLEKEKINSWLSNYEDIERHVTNPKTIATVMAGNIPAVGFHDFLCILISDNIFFGKLSSQDKILLPAMAEILIEIEPKFKSRISFTEDKLIDFDAIIATGSNNTTRYFEYYFGKYPNIIRGNRNGVAVIDGKDKESELKKLGRDIFMHFGLGCRNVSKIYLPKGYEIKDLIKQFDKFSYVFDNHKYRNNYDYYKSIYLVNRDSHLDNGFALFKEDASIASPVSVILYEFYQDTKVLGSQLESKADSIQCILSNNKNAFKDAIPFGESQKPEVRGYADNVDTMEFLLSLNKF